MNDTTLMGKEQRAAMMTAEYWGLNAEQAAAFSDDGNTVTIACPGSGKTRMCIAKAAKYALQFGPEKVMMVTFSKPAANQMRERLSKAIGPKWAKAVQIGTYHGLSYERLRNFYKSRGRSFKIISEGHSRSILNSIRERLARNIHLDDVLRGVATIKATHLTDDPIFSNTDAIAQIYLQYQSTLKDLNGKDFADLVREAARLYSEGTLAPYSCKHLIGDEWQDSDRMQLTWMLAHNAHGSNLHVVGDDDQSIYAFRNALGHVAFRDVAEPISASIHFLRTNYRCGRDIVLVADKVIAHNVSRIEKQFEVGSCLPGEVIVSSSHDALSEAEAVISQFEEMVDSANFKPVSNRFAVFHRTNMGLDYLEMAAVACKYNVIRDSKSSFADRPHVSQALALLTLAQNESDRLNWHQAGYLAGMSSEGYQAFESFVRRQPQDASMLDAVFSKDWLDSIGRQDKTLFSQLRAVALDWLDAAREIESESGADERWNGPLVEACFRIAMLCNAENVRRDIQFLGKVLGTKLKGDLRSRLLHVSKRPEREEDIDPESPALKLMTLHGSKGLEFDGAWIIGLNEGTLPSEGADWEEERRLLYVGITRGIVRVHLSYVKSPDTKISPFLQRLLDDLSA